MTSMSLLIQALTLALVLLFVDFVTSSTIVKSQPGNPITNTNLQSADSYNEEIESFSLSNNTEGLCLTIANKNNVIMRAVLQFSGRIYILTQDWLLYRISDSHLAGFRLFLIYSRPESVVDAWSVFRTNQFLINNKGEINLIYSKQIGTEMLVHMKINSTNEFVYNINNGNLSLVNDSLMSVNQVPVTGVDALYAFEFAANGNINFVDFKTKLSAPVYYSETKNQIVLVPVDKPATNLAGFQQMNGHKHPISNGILYKEYFFVFTPKKVYHFPKSFIVAGTKVQFVGIDYNDFFVCKPLKPNFDNSSLPPPPERSKAIIGSVVFILVAVVLALAANFCCGCCCSDKNDSSTVTNKDGPVQKQISPKSANRSVPSPKKSTDESNLIKNKQVLSSNKSKDGSTTGKTNVPISNKSKGDSILTKKIDETKGKDSLVTKAKDELPGNSKDKCLVVAASVAAAAAIPTGIIAAQSMSGAKANDTSNKSNVTSTVDNGKDGFKSAKSMDDASLAKSIDCASLSKSIDVASLAKKADETKFVKSSVGSAFLNSKDGASSATSMDVISQAKSSVGSAIPNSKDVSSNATSMDSANLAKSLDGTSFMKSKDGSSNVTSVDGTSLAKSTIGSVIPNSKDGTSLNPPSMDEPRFIKSSVKSAIPNSKDGPGTDTSMDITNQAKSSDGTSFMKSKDGSSNVTSVDGTSVVKSSIGSSITNSKDGSSNSTSVDGPRLAKSVDGTSLAKTTEGSSIATLTPSKDGTNNQKSVDPSSNTKVDGFKSAKSELASLSKSMDSSALASSKDGSAITTTTTATPTAKASNAKPADSVPNAAK